MLSEELSTDMESILTDRADKQDRITQLQDAILDLLTLTHTSIDYITNKTAFISPSPDLPVTQTDGRIAPAAEYRENIQVFVTSIVQRSKDIQKLISALPKKDDSSARTERLQELQSEMIVADREYTEALQEAEELLEKVQKALATALETPISRDPTLAPLAKQLSTQAAIDGEKNEPPDSAGQHMASHTDTEL